jgi:dTDP-4-amino-4,6-dideoxygalactose transaminase
MRQSSDPIAVPAIDLKLQYQSIRDEIDDAIRRVVENQAFILGPEVTAFEAEVASYCEVAHGVGCASGSDALLLPLLALGVERGDEVITSPYTFFATAGSIWRIGATPIFVDIESDTYNLDPSALEQAITPKTKAIIPVHLFGQSADMDPIREIAARRGLPIIEDAAQAIGAAYRNRRTGGLGQIAAFSFYPSKNLGGFGDAGMVTTDDPKLAKQIARLRTHGMEPKYHHHEVGFNSRLDALQAAVLRVKLRHLEAWTASRRQVADRYRSLFQEHGLAGAAQLPIERPGHFHVYNQYVIRVAAQDRNPLRDYLNSQKIGTEVYYPIPLHLQPCFAALGHAPGDFPHAVAAARETLALPMFAELTEAGQRHVVGSIANYFEQRSRATSGTERAA